MDDFVFKRPDDANSGTARLERFCLTTMSNETSDWPATAGGDLITTHHQKAIFVSRIIDRDHDGAHSTDVEATPDAPTDLNRRNPSSSLCNVNLRDAWAMAEEDFNRVACQVGKRLELMSASLDMDLRTLDILRDFSIQQFTMHRAASWEGLLLVFLLSGRVPACVFGMALKEVDLDPSSYRDFTLPDILGSADPPLVFWPSFVRTVTRFSLSFVASRALEKPAIKMKFTTFTTFAWGLLNTGPTLAGPAYAGYQLLSPRHATLEKRAECGPGVGSCNKGFCCSEGGWCGTTEEYCSGSACQLDYSDSCDTFFGPSGASTETVPRPKIGSVPYGTIISDCTVPQTMALTFDDGPFDYTSQILDILDNLKVRATFFVAGNNRGKGHIDDSSKPWPALLRRMHAAGHHIASHTWTHRDLNTVNSTIQKTEMIYNEMAFRNLFGWIPTYMRPPYLECNEPSGCLGLMNSLGYHVITNDIDTKDYENDDASLIQISKDRFSAGASTDSAHNEYIVLAHDVHYQTVVNLTAYMVQTTRARGYKLVTVGECLNDPKANWYRTVSGGTVPTSSTTLKASTKTSSTKTSPYATPTSTLKPSPNQKCGGSSGYTCLGSAFGNCCSFYGFCGSSASYCGTGCSPDFGTCTPGSGGISDTTNASVTGKSCEIDYILSQRRTTGAVSQGKPTANSSPQTVETAPTIAARDVRANTGLANETSPAAPSTAAANSNRDSLGVIFYKYVLLSIIPFNTVRPVATAKQPRRVLCVCGLCLGDVALACVEDAMAVRLGPHLQEFSCRLHRIGLGSWPGGEEAVNKECRSTQVPSSWVCSLPEASMVTARPNTTKPLLSGRVCSKESFAIRDSDGDIQPPGMARTRPKWETLKDGSLRGESYWMLIAFLPAWQLGYSG
ncbi:hypothetical protein G7046_g2551 [Stylonectria norvegica]|nr:hypothetical protein G7046_g2551 [Stylonectria norvegica]